MLREITLKDALHEIKLLISFPKEGSDWGDFEPLRNTTWAIGVREVSGESLSHAMHGWLLPLLKELGRPPQSSATRISAAEGRCRLAGECLGWDVHLCRPGGLKPKKKEQGPPGCYEAPLTNPVFAKVAAAWKNDQHTVVCLGGEFSLI